MARRLRDDAKTPGEPAAGNQPEDRKYRAEDRV
jgi:hypothetical protein